MTEQTRKLAAIVFTDIVGFTKLTADDQQKASDLLEGNDEFCEWNERPTTSAREGRMDTSDRD